MKRFLILAAAVVLFIGGVFWCDGGHAQTITVERTPQESDTIVILLGRGCRAASDQDWLQVCGAAVIQAQKEIEARKPKPPPVKP